MRTAERSRAGKPSVEILESRTVPATLVDAMTVTFQDIDGDNVTVKVSKPIFTADTINQVFTFANGGVDGDNSLGQQLQVIDFFKLSDPTAAAGTFLKVNARPSPAHGGNDRVNLGTIWARRSLTPDDLGIDLDLVKVDGDVAAVVAGDADLSTAAINALRAYSMGVHGTDNQPPFRGLLFSDMRGSLGSLLITTDTKAHLTVNFGNIGGVWIGGSLVGVDNLTGRIGTNGFPGRIGPVVVQGDVRGGPGVSTGVISGIEIESVTIGGSLIGSGNFSGRVTASRWLGPVRLVGSIVGAEGDHSGAVECQAGPLERVDIGGSVNGGAGLLSGVIRGNAHLGTVAIVGSVTGGAGAFSALIDSFSGDIASISIDGSLVGGSGRGSAFLFAGGDIGPASIRENLTGGTGRFSGIIHSSRDLLEVNIGGSIRSSGAEGSGSVSASRSLARLVVGGSVLGKSQAPVLIAAVRTRTKEGPSIGEVWIGGRVRFAQFLAGHDLFSAKENPDARIGSIHVAGDWIGGSAVAGAGAGPDGHFGTDDDEKLASPTDDLDIVSRIDSLFIGGEVIPTASDSDHFGIVAEHVISVRIGGKPVRLQPGPHNDDFWLGPKNKNDLRLREI